MCKLLLQQQVPLFDDRGTAIEEWLGPYWAVEAVVAFRTRGGRVCSPRNGLAARLLWYRSSLRGISAEAEDRARFDSLGVADPRCA